MNLKICFLSIINSQRYLDMFKITLKSFKLYNDFKIDWIILNDKDYNLHSDEQINIIQQRLKDVNEDEYIKTAKLSNYNCPFNLWVSRLKSLDEIKSKYDIICFVDCDLIFINSINNIINNFYNSNFDLLGQRTLAYTIFRDGIINKRNLNYSKLGIYPYKICFGLALLHCKNFPNNIWNTYLEKYNEIGELLLYQEESLITLMSKNTCFMDNISIFCNGSFINSQSFDKYYSIHFSNSYLLSTDRIADFNKCLTSYYYFEMYYKIAMNIDISENYREHLNKVHDKIKSWNKEDLEIMRKICNLPKAI